MSEIEISVVEESGAVDQAHKPITVTSRPRGSRPSASYLPPELIDHFHAKNYHIGLRARNDVMKAQDDAVGWRDIRLTEQPERIQNLMKELFSERDGIFTRGDWVVRERSFDAAADQRGWEDAMKDNLEGDDYFLNELDSRIGELSRDGGGAGEGVAFATKRSVRADVISGPAAVRAGLSPDDVLRAIEERRKSEE